MKDNLIITVDGPAGAGKSTVSKILSKKISYIYLDTGALYRAIAYKVAEYEISPDNEDLLSELCKKVTISIESMNGNMKVLIDGEDVTAKIRTERTGLLASKVSAVPAVRETLLSIQRKAGESGGLIAEGRDMGTVVFPYADLKFFINADAEERARRRYRELVEKGRNVNLEDVKRALLDRDQRDTTRNISPLKPSDDSAIIDTTFLNVEEVVEKMLGIIEEF
ncbi:MAG: (d)CMP kinase [Syntrophobacterales bacterium]|nr:(d)CMP kinase [Syntrophobacterales bacterium]